METCDVLIVGGGPAGSTCAQALTQAGLDVVVLDKALFPRDKTCAGWITPAVVDALALPVDEYRDSGRVFQPITAFRTSRLGGREVHTRFDRAVSYGIRRCELDHFLLQRSGARVRAGEALRSLRRERERWVVNETIAAPIVVGAGGHFCPVARQLRAASLSSAVKSPADDESVVAAQEIEVPLTPAQAAACRVDGETPELYLCEDLAGYGWCFRKGPVLNVGLGRQDTHHLSRHVRELVERLIAMHRIPSDLPWKWKGHAYLLRGVSRRPVVGDGVLLIGDAAGLAYARSGEGIRPAVESGLLAAETILEARGRWQTADLEPYRQRLRARFGDDAATMTAGVTVPARAAAAMAGLLLANAWFTRNVFLRRWFLRADEPQLPLRMPPLQSKMSVP
jgi:menaquinone-9 beta-reductase